jgi:hypothetical protein
VGASFVDPSLLGVCDPIGPIGGDCTSLLTGESG